MFNARIQDHSDNCNIIKHSLVDDLIDWDVDSSLGINFKDSGSSAIGSKITELASLIKDNTSLEVWQPIFIDHDNFIQNKMLSDYGSYQNANPLLKSGRIGIESFYGFYPIFKHWVTSGATMEIDWILNKANCAYAINYGIMGWYKILDPMNSRSVGGLVKTIDQFPNGARLKNSAQSDKIYIKIDNNLLYDVTTSSTSLDLIGSWTFKDESQTSLVEVSSLGTNPLFSLSDIYYENNSKDPYKDPSKNNIVNTLLGVNSYLWVPDGDFFSYFYSDMDKQLSLSANIPSCSYISSGLYNIYSNIYRIITMDEPRSFAKKDLRKARAYKKLAHALSTSPFIYDFSMHALDYIEIRKIIQNYILEQNSINSIAGDMTILKNALFNISQILQATIGANNTVNQNLCLDTKSSFRNFNNNLIVNQQQLFKKLINKYGAKLVIKGNAVISPKQNTVKYNNDGVVITQVLDSYVEKNTTDATIFNDQKILFDSTIISVDNANNKLSILNGTSETAVPLADCAKPGYGTGSNFNISLIYSGNVNRLYRNDGIFFQPQGSAETYIFESDLDNNAPIELSALDILPEIRSYGERGFFNEIDFLKSKINVLWEKISGPTGFFGKTNGVAGISPDTIFYAGGTGKFVVQCTAATPFGTYKKRKTFYVVDGRQLLSNNSADPPFVNPNYGKYIDIDASTPNSWITPPSTNPNNKENTPILLNKDHLTVQVSKINSIAINNMAGVVWPIKTNLSVRENTGRLGRVSTESIFELSGDYKFTYNTQYSARVNNPTLSLSFNSNNTIIKIHSIFLEKIRSNEPGCENCLSFYEPKITARNTVFYTYDGPDPAQPSTVNNLTRYYRSNKYPQDFIFVSYKRDETNKMVADQYLIFIYPYISTMFSPPIKSYGGYSTNFINSTINTIPDHPLPNDTASGIISNNSPILPTVFGYKLDYRNDRDPSLPKMCYQKAIVGVPPTGSVMKFTKGVFHPSSGWIPYSGVGYQIHANRCGILKFNPGARDSFSFVGPSLSSIKNNDIDIVNNNINSKIFSSSINLSIAREIQWDPECSCEASGEMTIEQYNNNQIHKEYTDIHYNISNHGYRNLAGGVPKQSEKSAIQSSSFVNDEFLTNYNSDNNITSYSFAVTGPAFLPAKNENGLIKLRNPRINNFGIKDIEIKLNFLNYVNTKNLVVWLEVDFDSSEKKNRYPANNSKPPSPIRSNSEFIDQSFDPKIIGTNDWSSVNTSTINSIHNSLIYNYLLNLTDMNSNKVGEPFKLYLLNQENIDHNQFNFSVKFSDNASKYNTPYNLNILPCPTGQLNNPPSPPILNNMLLNKVSFIKNNDNSTHQSIYQNIINNQDILPPTVAATGYTDRQCCTNGSIIKHNRLNITNNTFSKFISKSLFRGIIPDSGPCDGAAKQKEPDLNGSTTFTLKMMVLDETDDMYPSDNIDYQYKPGLDTAQNNSLSSMIANSLCNWELILHVGPVHKPVPYTSPNIMSYGNSDILSLLNYDIDPEYPGYSFISDLSAYKHLLPIANLNAPHACIADTMTCFGDNGSVEGGSVTLRPPEFPSYAILQIIAGIAIAAGATGGTLIGLSAVFDSIINNPGWNTIINWFRETRFFEELQDRSRELYMPVYDKYAFGSPEKMLILFKKSNSLWYNAEATIFKYHNTPILKPNRYKFIRTQRGNGKHISEFKYQIVSDYTQLIDTKNIKSINCKCEDWETLKTSNIPARHQDTIVMQGDLVNIDLDTKCSDQNGLYTIVASNNTDTASWVKITDSTLDQISETIHFSTHNSIMCGGKAFFDSGLVSAMSGNRVIMSPSRIPYDLFSVTDKIECYDQGESSLPAPSSLITTSIINKALIFKDNQYYSVLTLDSSVEKGNALSPASGENIFFVFNNQTSVEDKIKKQYNMWGLDANKELVGSQTTHVEANTHSAGSYGDLSLFTDKNLLSNNIRHNHLENYHTIFNNKINDKIKYNNIKIYDKNNVEQNMFKNVSAYGFAYSEKDFANNLFDTKNLCYYITPEYLKPDGDTRELFTSLKNQIQLSTSTENEIQNRYGYIKTKVEPGSGLPPDILSGELTIENDFIEHIPVRVLTDAEISQLQSRILLIDDDQYHGVDHAIGIAEQTIIVLQSNNLPSIIKHYQTLPNDPAHCHRPNSPGTECYKQKTEQKINDLYLERKEILDLLDYQTIRMASIQNISGEIISETEKYIVIKPLGEDTKVTRIEKRDLPVDSIARFFKSKASISSKDPRFLNNSIIPKLSPVINTDNITGSIIITYDIVNTNHYWINIDPKQSTFKDFEKNPKVLVDTTYTCQLANPLISNPIMKNNVCPFTNKEQFLSTGDGISDSFNGKPNTYTYTVPVNIVEQNKTQFQNSYPSIKNWKFFTKVRYFNINGDQTLDDLSSLEVIVKSEEKYLVPETNEDSNQLEYNDGSADTHLTDDTALAGIPICGSNLGSPAGRGLLDTYGYRVGKPTRVCNIMNLDNINDIEVIVKRIPRLLRGVDLLSTIYRYGFKNIFRQTNITNPLVPTEIDLASPNGAINNSLYYWTCLQQIPGMPLIEKAALPEFFLLQNEMMFRALFGSVDKIENRTNVATSYFPWELIPYEYSRSPQ